MNINRLKYMVKINSIVANKKWPRILSESVSKGQNIVATHRCNWKS